MILEKFISISQITIPDNVTIRSLQDLEVAIVHPIGKAVAVHPDDPVLLRWKADTGIDRTKEVGVKKD